MSKLIEKTIKAGNYSMNCIFCHQSLIKESNIRNYFLCLNERCIIDNNVRYQFAYRNDFEMTFSYFLQYNNDLYQIFSYKFYENRYTSIYKLIDDNSELQHIFEIKTFLFQDSHQKCEEFLKRGLKLALFQ